MFDVGVNLVFKGDFAVQIINLTFCQWRENNLRLRARVGFTTRLDPI